MAKKLRRKRKVSNPLRVDPTKSATLRRRFIAHVRKKLKNVLLKMIDLIVTQDVFGLDRQSHFVRNEDWSFKTDEGKAKEFEDWLKNEVETEFAGDWWKAYITDGYIKGFGRVFDDLKKYGIEPDPSLSNVYIGSKEDFLKTSFAQAVTKAKLDLIMERTLGDLKGMTGDMEHKLKRAIIDGLIAGKNPRDIARDITKQVEVSRRRAETIARTEIIRAHAEGQIDSFEKLGGKRLKVLAEWLTAGDDRVCQQCADQEGKTFELEDARNRIPLHPNCRCCWIPANVGEDGKVAAVDKQRSRLIPDSKEPFIDNNKFWAAETEFGAYSDSEASRRLDRGGGKSITVDPRTLIPTQDYVGTDKVLAIAGKWDSDKAEVLIIQDGDKMYIHDGHHTAAAAIYNGLDSVKARVVVVN